jgi:hypothetical protein
MVDDIQRAKSQANLVIGHHPHIPKGIEVCEGKVIFHGFCNFALELPFQFDSTLKEPARRGDPQPCRTGVSRIG